VIGDFDEWWEQASDAERQAFLDDCLFLDDAVPARAVTDVIRDLADYQP
jgi:hypothetical protein